MKQEYDIKRELKRLASIRGAGTELISIYVPPDFQISEEIAKLRDEHSQSSNIKSKTTKLNVQGAIEKIIQYLKLYNKPPKNGIAVFCGNISKEQAKTDIELFSIEPPQPIKANIYRCDSSFLIEPIESMMEAKDMYVLLVMDGRDATIATLKGTGITVEKTLRSFAHAKVHKGGQSAARYTRAIEESISDYYKEISSSINDVFKKYDFKIKGLVVGGPGPAKENFVRENELNYQVKIIGVFDTGYTDEHTGMNELLDKAKDLLSEQAVMGERRLMERFLKELSKNGLATYGYDNVKKALDANAVDKLLISEDIELRKVHYKCGSCGFEITRIEEGNSRLEKHDCGGNFEIVEQSDPVEELLEKADKQGVETTFISSEGQYGQELILGFKGIAALLKYRP